MFFIGVVICKAKDRDENRNNFHLRWFFWTGDY